MVKMATRGGSWCGVDQSSKMIGVARRKGGAVDWVVADAARLPYADRTFSGAICTLAIHHFDSLEPAFAEVHRVLSAGRFVVFTATPEQTEGYWLAEYFPEAIRRSAKLLPGLGEVSDALCGAGFEGITTEPYAVREDLRDLFLYSGKHRPGLYLDPDVRRKITTSPSSRIKAKWKEAAGAWHRTSRRGGWTRLSRDIPVTRAITFS